MNPEELGIIASKKKGVSKLSNPFPGLRPFTFEESHLFFGREGQSDAIIKNLAKHRFTAVIGTSGSGKSSLMYCGILPRLYDGFQTETGSAWMVLSARPGISPLENLAESLLANDEPFIKASDKEKREQIHDTANILREKPSGIVDVLERQTANSNKNILIPTVL